MDSPAVLCIGAGSRTGTGDNTAREADLRAFEFVSAFGRFSTIPAHNMSLSAHRHPVIVDGKIVLINRRAAAFSIQVNERTDAMVAAVFIERHGVMGRVQEEFSHNGLREELFKGEPVIKEAMGIMPGSGAKERENGQVIFRVGGSEHIQVIAKVIAFPMRIPADVTVRLAVKAVASAVADTIFEASAGTFFPFPGGSIDRSAVTGKGKIQEVNKPFANGMFKEKGAEDPIKEPAGFHAVRGLLFKEGKKVFHGGLFNRRSLLAFLVRFFRLFLRRMERAG